MLPVWGDSSDTTAMRLPSGETTAARTYRRPSQGAGMRRGADADSSSGSAVALIAHRRLPDSRPSPAPPTQSTPP